MKAKGKAAGDATPTAAEKENLSPLIIPFDDEKVKEEAVKKLTEQDKEAKYDKYGAIMHSAVLEALCEFCRQNAEFARAICETDKHFDGCLKAVAKGCGNGISDLDAFTRAVDFYFSGATISFKMLIDVGDGVLSDRTPEAAAPVPEPLEITLDNLMDW